MVPGAAPSPPASVSLTFQQRLVPSPPSNVARSTQAFMAGGQSTTKALPVRMALNNGT